MAKTCENCGAKMTWGYCVQCKNGAVSTEPSEAGGVAPTSSDHLLDQIARSTAQMAKDVATLKNIAVFFTVLWILGMILLVVGLNSGDDSGGGF